MTIFQLIYGMWCLTLAGIVVYTLFRILTAPARRTIRELQAMDRVTQARLEEVIEQRKSYRA